MPKPRPKGKKKAAATHYCSGFTDKHGQWNNGFPCPIWGSPDQVYCCGEDTHRFCCPEPDQYKLTNAHNAQLPLVLGAVVGAVVLLALLGVIFCYFCQCCWVYKRRKRSLSGTGICPHHHSHQMPGRDFAVNYSLCPHQPYHAESNVASSNAYPVDDPPPYPGGPSFPCTEEKVALHSPGMPLTSIPLYVRTEGPGDTPVTIPLTALTSNPNAFMDLRGQVTDLEDQDFVAQESCFSSPTRRMQEYHHNSLHQQQPHQQLYHQGNVIENLDTASPTTRGRSCSSGSVGITFTCGSLSDGAQGHHHICPGEYRPDTVTTVLTDQALLHHCTCSKNKKLELLYSQGDSDSELSDSVSGPSHIQKGGGMLHTDDAMFCTNLPSKNRENSMHKKSSMEHKDQDH